MVKSTFRGKSATSSADEKWLRINYKINFRITKYRMSGRGDHIRGRGHKGGALPKRGRPDSFNTFFIKYIVQLPGKFNHVAELSQTHSRSFYTTFYLGFKSILGYFSRRDLV